MATSPVQVEEVASIPLAVIRRQASPSQLARLVPQCCGLVWTAVRAQQANAGRHVALYWDRGIQLDVGVELLGPFVEQGEVVRSGPRWEVYGHWEDAWNSDPSQIRTDVYYLIDGDRRT